MFQTWAGVSGRCLLNRESLCRNVVSVPVNPRQVALRPVPEVARLPFHYAGKSRQYIFDHVESLICGFNPICASKAKESNAG